MELHMDHGMELDISVYHKVFTVIEYYKNPFFQI